MTNTGPHTCRCGFTTWICRDEVTPAQWAHFEWLFRAAFAWASDHLSDGSDPEEFAAKFAGENWDDPEPPSFPAQHAADLRDREREQAADRAVVAAERRREARLADARARASRRRAALVSQGC